MRPPREGDKLIIYLLNLPKMRVALSNWEARGLNPPSCWLDSSVNPYIPHTHAIGPCFYICAVGDSG